MLVTAEQGFGWWNSCTLHPTVTYFLQLLLLLLLLLVQLLLTPRLLMSYIYGAPSKARNANVVYIWTYVWQR